MTAYQVQVLTNRYLILAHKSSCLKHPAIFFMAASSLLHSRDICTSVCV